MADKDIPTLTAGTDRTAAIVHGVEGGNSRKFTGLGKVAQVVGTPTGAMATGTTTIPADDTIPQNTEGTEFMTQAITPKHASSTLVIDVHAFLSSSDASRWVIGALFRDSVADALAVGAFFVESVVTSGATLVFRHVMTAGGVSLITFRFRAGPNGAATVTFNGQGGARRWGGVAASSIVVTEYLP